jgi:hypothetical protein
MKLEKIEKCYFSFSFSFYIKWLFIDKFKVVYFKGINLLNILINFVNFYLKGVFIL